MVHLLSEKAVVILDLCEIGVWTPPSSPYLHADCVTRYTIQTPVMQNVVSSICLMDLLFQFDLKSLISPTFYDHYLATNDLSLSRMTFSIIQIAKSVL